MNRIIAFLTIINLSFVSLIGAGPTLDRPTFETSGYEGADNVVTFTVQHHDVAVRLVNPKKLSADTLTGRNVTICLANTYELISTECHWDGVSETNRYAYTIHYRLPGIANTHYTYSLNLTRFSSIFIGRSRNTPAIVQEIGVVPTDGIVAFESVPFEVIVNGNNAGTYFAGPDKGVFDKHWHETGRLSNGERYAVLGSVTYLLDRNGIKISKGYHSITPTETGYVAKLGAEIYHLDGVGKEVPNPK